MPGSAAPPAAQGAVVVAGAQRRGGDELAQEQQIPAGVELDQAVPADPGAYPGVQLAADLAGQPVALAGVRCRRLAEGVGEVDPYRPWLVAMQPRGPVGPPRRAVVGVRAHGRGGLAGSAMGTEDSS